MNTNVAAKTILCYGDSNTFGQRSDDVAKGRWPIGVRWTSRLRQLLGDDYYVIEEGLSSRTTNLDYSGKPGRNGKTYLIPCLQSHNPIELVIIMLGTNDLKDEFNRSPQDVASAMQELVVDILHYAESNVGAQAKILIVSPIYIDDTAAHFAQFYSTKYSHAAALKSHELAACFKRVALEAGCEFLDAAAIAVPGEDGIHLSYDSHEKFAQALDEYVIKLCS